MPSARDLAHRKGEQIAVGFENLAVGLVVVDQDAEPVLHLGEHGRDRHRNGGPARHRSEEHTSELQSLMRISYAVFCLKKKKKKCKIKETHTTNQLRRYTTPKKAKQSIPKTHNIN